MKKFQFADETGEHCAEIEYIWVAKFYNHCMVQAVIGISTWLSLTGRTQHQIPQ